MSVCIRIDERPDVWVLSAEGELDYSECASFRLEIDRILRVMPPACVVDFSEVTYLDSSGLGLLLSLSRDYTNAGGRFMLVTNETVDGILELTRLTGAFDTAITLDEAIERIRAQRPAQPTEAT